MRGHRDRASLIAPASASVYAGRNGIIGALTEDLIDTSKESPRAIAALMHTPAGAFGSCRYKLKGLDKNRAQYERLIEVFRAHDIGYFFYNGGNDSADTCLKVSQISARMGYPICAVHVPKTVDNDLPITDCCPGFGSVAKYVATSMREAAFDVASMAKTSTRIFVLEVMGRHAGWITAAVGLAPTTRPRRFRWCCCFPEIRFDEAEVPGAGRCAGEAVRLLLHRRVRRLARRRGRADGGGGHDATPSATRSSAVSGRDRRARQGQARPQISLGGRRLPAARGAPSRVEDRRAAELRGGQGGGRVRARRVTTR